MTQIHKIPKNKKYYEVLFKQAVGKMAQWLRVFTALEEDSSSAATLGGSQPPVPATPGDLTP